MIHRLLLCSLLLLAFTGIAFGDIDRFVNSTGKGTLAVEMDRDDWAATEPITGKLIIHITEVLDREGRPLDAVRLNEPKLDIVFPDDMAAVLPQVKWRTTFFPTIKVGHRYELAFTIRTDEAFEALVKKGNADLVMFKPGKYEISAMLDSPARAPWDTPKRNPIVELHQKFTTTSTKTITISPTAGGRVIGNDEVKKALEESKDSLRHHIATFYAKRKIISREDLLATIDASAGKPKADLAALYLSLGYAAKDLTFFTPVSDSLKLAGHEGGPLYLLLRPQQRVQFACDLAVLHRLRVASLDTVLTAKQKVNFDAPRGEGVYEMYDDLHKKAWGWILVHVDKTAIAAAGLRPDTRELSAKVAEAIFKQDAKTLESLSAPGFRVDETMKKLRFRLADGDIRYHESTGTTTKVKTIMKINLAPKDAPPALARELWLDYALVGEELRLTHAAVWDVEK